MASATFTGNVFNEVPANLNCYFQAYHVQQDSWSDVRLTEYNQYSIDLADSDWLTNSNGASNNGENVLICFWVDDDNEPTNPSGSSRSGLKPRFSILRVNLNGSNVYNYDVQIIPKTEPTCTWSIPSTGTINNVINSSHSSTDVYQWTYNGVVLYHDDIYFGEPMFDSVGIATHEYDWETGYTSSSSHTYTVIGDYTPLHKPTNQYGLFSECPDNIRIKYNQPTGYFTFSNDNPILNEEVTLNHHINDPDSRITNIRYLVNGVEQAQNTVLNHSYNYILDELGTYNINMEIYWNDGWEDKVVYLQDTLTLSNVPPTLDLSINIEDTVATFISNAIDFEDRMDNVVFKIYVAPEYIFEETPTNVTWSLLSTNTVSVAPYDAAVTFYRGGQFKVTATAYDLDGGVSALDEVEFAMSADGGVIPGPEDCDVYAGNQFFDWE